jgi:endonuclease-8
MEGAWLVFAAGQGWRGGPTHQIRAILENEAGAAVGYRLPVLELMRTADEHRVVGHLGPDLLGEDWDPAEALRRLRRAPDRAVGEALLDQKNLAGVGNVYKAELCFLAGANPWTPVGALPDLPRLVAQAHRLLEFNRERTVRVTTGDTRPGRSLWVYGRKRATCLRCGTPIRHADQGPAGEARITYWCPSCQPEAGASPPVRPLS